MVSQPIRCTDSGVTTGTGELLPRLFTLIRQLADGYFLLHYYTLADIFPLGNMVLFVARTFLPEFSGRWNSLLYCKGNNYFQDDKRSLIWLFLQKNNNSTTV